MVERQLPGNLLGTGGYCGTNSALGTGGKL